MINQQKYSELTKPVCSNCGGPCRWHGYEGCWVFQCLCQGRGNAQIVEEHARNRDWDREDD